MLEIKNNVLNLFPTDDLGHPTSPQSLRNGQEASVDFQNKMIPMTTMVPCGSEHIHDVTASEPLMIEKLARLERDMARLKSVNLGLLQHSLDLQSTLKSSEIELAANKQEIALIRDEGNTKSVSDFVNAAVREHAALRRQSELALIQVKRLKIQLTATEANYQVVANEATSYKLSAYRLYRRYIEEMVAVVDYIRFLQRSCKGSISPHRAEIMDKRFRLILDELNLACERNKSLVTDLSDKLNDIKTFKQQISFLRMEKKPGGNDAIEQQFLDARSTTRSAIHKFTECEENLKFSEAKAQRMEVYTKELSEEIARLEFRCWNMKPLEEASYEKLLHLRDTVFAKAEAPPLAVQPIETVSLHGGTGETGKMYLGADDDDTAIREYKTSILKQKELARECTGLRAELDAKSREIQTLTSNVHNLQDNIKHLENKTILYQGQLEGERVKAEEREARLRKAHEVQSEVAWKATERNCDCLRDMVQRKDKEIHQLQRQLHAERQKYAELKLEDASRLERFHERMFSENEAMIERFKNAVQDKADIGNDNEQSQPALLGTDNSIFEQLRGLTSDNIRLKRELQEAQAANVVLESQLSQQNQDLQSVAQTMIGSGFKVSISGLHVDGTGGERVVQSHSSVKEPVSPSLGVSTACQPASNVIKRTDILTGIINNQGAMIESLRQREVALSNELQQEKKLHNKAYTALHELQSHQVEQEGTLRLATQVSTVASDSALVRELRSNILYLELELRNTKEALDQEKILSNRLQTDVEDWKKHLESLQLEVSHQRIEVESSVHLSALNQALQSDLGAVKEQNEKLMTAVSLLKDKLMVEAQKGSETTRQHHQELALARRMGVIQNESMQHIKVLDHRIKSIQQELNERVEKEKEALTRYEDTQRMVYQLHQNLRHKEADLVKLKQQLHHLHAEKGRPGVDLHFSGKTQVQSIFREKGIQVIATDLNPGAGTLAPYPCAPTIIQPSAVDTMATLSTDYPSHAKSVSTGIAQKENNVSLIVRKARKMEFDNLQCISELRSQLARTEKDLADAREHLTAAHENNSKLRQQLRSHKKDMEEMGKRHVCEVAQLRSFIVSNRHPPKTTKDAPLATDPQQHIAIPKSNFQARDNVELVKSQAIQQQEQQHDGIVKGLYRQLQVDVPANENTLHRHIVKLNATIDRLVDRLAHTERSSPDEVRRTYSVPNTEKEKSIAALQDELLKKDDVIQNLHSTQESLNLQISRLQSRIMECTDSGKSVSKSKKLLQEQLLSTQKAQHNQMEAMVATIGNVKVLIEHLRVKNSELTLQTSHMAKYDEALSEMRRLRSKLGAIQDNFMDLLRISSALAQSAVAYPSDRHPRLRQRLPITRTEVDGPDVQPETFQTPTVGQAHHTLAEG
ncbi:unnamed protein product [Phytomonas sp. Hart1]|nr:unnamed protein product [Phytomonas sp. Hart1]|eukprot:CCW68804.1 unnamed protein product [Phytomonas sp. isolate Hart1]